MTVWPPHYARHAWPDGSASPAPPAVDVVVPTVGRPSLARLLAALAAAEPLPRRVIVVDDRRRRSAPLLERPLPDRLQPRLTILPGPGRGPAAARNVGWRAATSVWVAFLDDDVVPAADWLRQLTADLAPLPGSVAASQGRIRVPLPDDRRPTDWERNVAGLAAAVWATADMAYRVAVLAEVGGFDERFRHAYREDADLGLRVTRRGYRIVRGRRHVTHPVGDSGPWVSLGRQRGNADDMLMRALHGRHWQRDARVPPGRRPRHLAVTAWAAAGAAGVVMRRPLLAAAGLGAWLGGTVELVAARVLPGPRTPTEVARMVATSVALPLVATLHTLRGVVTVPYRRRRPARSSRHAAASGEPRAVLFDRDGTLVHDVPYNGDPDQVRPVAGAGEAVARVRAAGLLTGVVTNQSGVGRGRLGRDDVTRVNRRVDELLGPFDVWEVCSHHPDDGCDCRKPAPGLVVRAAARLGVAPRDCVVIGDTGGDVAAALAAGARAILVPTAVTRPDEVGAAPHVATDLATAVTAVLPQRSSLPARTA